MTEELYKQYRPTRLSDLVGQDAAVGMLTEMGRQGKIPHCLLLTGPSGCGKTTIARILKAKLKCSDHDFEELNCAGDARGIDTIREIKQRMGFAPMGGAVRIWLLDEAGKLTNDAQTALLKILEDTPQHVYFMLATTDPHKLIPTIKTRSTEIQVKALNAKDMEELLVRVAEKADIPVTEEVLEAIVEVAEGSARKALVLLNQIRDVQSPMIRIATIRASVAGTEGIELARELTKPKPSWSEVARIIKGLDQGVDPEGLRRLVLAYCTSMMLSGGTGGARAYRVYCCFERNFFDTGKAGLVASCWDAVNGK